MTDQNQTETPARRGRPASFPGQETKALLAHIPTATRDRLVAEAAIQTAASESRVPMNVILDAAINAAIDAAEAKRTQAAARAAKRAASKAAKAPATPAPEASTEG